VAEAGVKLLIDEHLSPRLIAWCAERRSVYAASVAHVGLAGRSDAEVWGHALEHDFVVVTANARDFLELLNVELHPGLIVLREGGLSREEQWARLEAALDHVQSQPDPAAYMVNRVVEVVTVSEVAAREIPTP
jgi:predicted nuclease of predicted toxin-antitoxin system